MNCSQKSDGMAEPIFWGYLFDNTEIMPLGWYDMKEWSKGFDKVLQDAYEIANDLETSPAFPIRGDLFESYLSDIQYLIKCRDGKYEDY